MTTCWRGVLDAERKKAARAVAREVASRAADRSRISEAWRASRQQTHYPETLRWDPHALSAGDGGLALLCAAFDAAMPEDGWDVAGHNFLVTAALAAERARHLEPGLFTGLSGLAFAAAQLSRKSTRYQRLLGSLDGELAPKALALAQRLRAGGTLTVGTFDVISGASGVGAYLLERDPHDVLPSILEGLVALSEMDGVPRWATPPELMGPAFKRERYPRGNLNCGLAHGIPGPLALLALALRVGRGVAGQDEAIRRLGEWIVAHRIDDRWGVNWPGAVPLPPGEGVAAARAAWCYGSPGVARALWIAGDALGETNWCDVAVEAMLAVARRPLAERRVDSPTFCHGVAGLLQIVLRFANDTGRPEVFDAASALADQLLEAYDPARPLGYAALEPGRNPVDRPGLLDGAPGVAMVLLAAASDVEPRWDRIFLLS